LYDVRQGELQLVELRGRDRAASLSVRGQCAQNILGAYRIPADVGQGVVDLMNDTRRQLSHRGQTLRYDQPSHQHVVSQRHRRMRRHDPGRLEVRLPKRSVGLHAVQVEHAEKVILREQRVDQGRPDPAVALQAFEAGIVHQSLRQQRRGPVERYLPRDPLPQCKPGLALNHLGDPRRIDDSQ
jgi:hypothetical protein